jgi:SAM-dependent methyltransferase
MGEKKKGLSIKERYGFPDEFQLVYCGLPRAGPGSDGSTRRALRYLPELPGDPLILDLGCGPGRQTLVLAEELNAKVTAIDIHYPFLERVEKAAEKAGLAHLVETRHISMDELDYAEGSIDLIWSEGAVYQIGFERGLEYFRPLLKPGGLIGLTEPVWLTDNPETEVREFWKEYPDLKTVDAALESVEALGYKVLGRFTLPGSDWWDEYYSPMSERIEQLRPGANDILAQIIAGAETEIDMHRRFGGQYGYEFIIIDKNIEC